MGEMGGRNGEVMCWRPGPLVTRHCPNHQDPKGRSHPAGRERLYDMGDGVLGCTWCGWTSEPIEPALAALDAGDDDD